MAKKKGPKVPVSMRALIQRINRKLAKEDAGAAQEGAWERLKAARSERAAMDVGWYYVVDLRQNFIVQKNVDVEAMGREMGVLADYERLEEE